MLNPTWLFLFLTILGTIYTEGNAANPNCNNGTGQDICKNIEEFIEEQVQNSTATLLPTINKSKLNIEKDIKDAANKIIYQLAVDINQIINKINTAFVETKLEESNKKINDEITALKNTNNIIKQDIQKLLNATEDKDKTPACGVFKVPDSVKTRTDIWGKRDLPKMDDLDTYVNKTRGCEYEAVQFFRDPHYLPEYIFDGTPIEIRFAVRTQENARVSVWWKPIVPENYAFDIGADKNTNTKLINYDSRKTLDTQSTPGILSESRYEEFYIKIDNDTLTFGKKCDKPLISHKINIGRNDRVYMKYKSYSESGGKLIFNCPTEV